VLTALLRSLSGERAYPPSPADERTIVIAGLRLPVRATIAVAVMVFVVIFDFNRTFIPDELIAYDRNPGMQRLQAIDRAFLYGLVPLLVIGFLFRDRPSAYGLQLGDWRTGAALAIAGCVVMTPVVLWFAGLPDARTYYAPSFSTIPDVALTSALDLVSAEFLFRGFLMFALVRAIGPIGVLVATLPFVFSHLTKPELELFSTLFGGMIYGWLAWRTGSILWGAAAHIYILTLLIIVAGMSAGGQAL
jgi:membrane protease YdiL (CAAX protease family)